MGYVLCHTILGAVQWRKWDRMFHEGQDASRQIRKKDFVSQRSIHDNVDTENCGNMITRTGQTNWMHSTSNKPKQPSQYKNRNCSLWAWTWKRSIKLNRSGDALHTDITIMQQSPILSILEILLMESGPEESKSQIETCCYFIFQIKRLLIMWPEQRYLLGYIFTDKSVVT